LNADAAQIYREFDARSFALKGDGDALVIPQFHNSRSEDPRAAKPYSGIGGLQSLPVDASLRHGPTIDWRTYRP
jgi:hypothetical protein